MQAATQLVASQALASTREFTHPRHISDTICSCCRRPPLPPPPPQLKSTLYNGSIPTATCSKSRVWQCTRTASGTSTCFIRWPPCTCSNCYKRIAGGGHPVLMSACLFKPCRSDAAAGKLSSFPCRNSAGQPYSCSLSSFVFLCHRANASLSNTALRCSLLLLGS